MFPKWIGKDSFKFLGKSLVEELSSRSAKKNVLGKYKNYLKLLMRRINETLLTGAQKLWIWEHFAMRKMTWDFLVHDFPPSFLKTKLQPIQAKYLKKRSGLARTAHPSVLYRSRENAVLGMREACEEHKRQRVIRRHQLATSEERKAKVIHEEFADFQCQRKTNEWKETPELGKLQAEAKIRQVMGQAADGAGIGFGYQLRGRPCEEMLRVFKEIYEEERLVNVMSKILEDSDPNTHTDEKKGNYFCAWLKWKNAMMVDLRWDQLLQKQDSYLRFVPDATLLYQLQVG